MEERKTTSEKKLDLTSIIIAFVIDVCLVFLAYFALYALIIRLPGLSDSYKSNRDTAIRVQDTLKIEYEVGYKLYETSEDYKLEKYNEYIVYSDQTGNYKVISYASKDLVSEKVNNYKNALNENADYRNSTFMIALIEYAMRIIAVFISELVLLLIIPFINKNRSTIGRLSTKTILTNKKTSFEATRWQIFARFMYTFFIQTAILGIYINPLLILLIILALNVIVMIL